METIYFEDVVLVSEAVTDQTCKKYVCYCDTIYDSKNPQNL